MNTSSLNTLKQIRDYAGKPQTLGLSDEVVTYFINSDPELERAVSNAEKQHSALKKESGHMLSMAEDELCEAVQRDYLSFYGDEARCPYVPLAASGPWIVTTHGAVIHDSGGYGMLGLGHDPKTLNGCLSTPHVMANIMTPSLNQLRFADRLKREIGHTRGSCPFSQFLCMNSGSESVTVASRICDLNAYKQTDKGGKQAGKKIHTLSLEGSFHGRTELAARASHSTFKTYKANLASYRSREEIQVVAPNDLEGLKSAFEIAQKKEIFFDAFFIEPVLGEGIPGMALTREFYDLARKLTEEHGSMLVVDSIQAGLRAQGHLSIVDYPGFEDCPPPDMETYSKALNGGQYPLSVLAMTRKAAGCYVEGIYGNTMTANPRALDVGCAILDAITDELRWNICRSGTYFLNELKKLAAEYPKFIESVHGTGLIVCAEMNPNHISVTGQHGLEGQLRRRGVSMVHGGKNGLRFTPHFAIKEVEIDMIIAIVKDMLLSV